MIKTTGLDHLVLTVKDPDATCRFYETVLGLEVVTFAGDRQALVCGAQKINLHRQGQELAPRAQHPTPGSADLCLITSTPLPEVMAHLSACGVPLVAGPVRRTGARGPIDSVYFRDPDLNLIEVAKYVES
jgi:catechol 2,3-dioxygenase-like lactoylglutathione lyase family enzyme